MWSCHTDGGAGNFSLAGRLPASRPRPPTPPTTAFGTHDGTYPYLMLQDTGASGPGTALWRAAIARDAPVVWERAILPPPACSWPGSASLPRRPASGS